MNGVDTANELSLRVSVATVNQVVFHHPLNETLMLALERKATVSRDRENNIRVCSDSAHP